MKTNEYFQRGNKNKPLQSAICNNIVKEWGKLKNLEFCLQIAVQTLYIFLSIQMKHKEKSWIYIYYNA